MQLLVIAAWILLNVALLNSLRSGRLWISPNYKSTIIDRETNPRYFWIAWCIYFVGINFLLVNISSR